MDKMVSIVTISYNEQERIRKTIDSVINQSIFGRSIEYIIIDGGSTDLTVPIIREYINKIDYFISEPDLGIYHAMNKGIQKAHGDYVLFLNSGDILYNNKVIEKILPYLETLDVDILFANGINNVYNTLHPLPFSKKNRIAPEMFFLNTSICHQAEFIRLTLFKTVGLYDLGYKIIADHVFNYIAFFKYHCSWYFVDEIVALVDIYGISSKDTECLRKERKRMYREVASPKVKLVISIMRTAYRVREIFNDLYCKIRRVKRVLLRGR